jgi:hypothetical protein
VVGKAMPRHRDTNLFAATGFVWWESLRFEFVAAVEMLQIESLDIWVKRIAALHLAVVTAAAQ